MGTQPVRMPPALQLVRLKGQVLVPLPTVLLALVAALLLYHLTFSSGGASIAPPPQPQHYQHGVPQGSWLNRANDSWPVSR